jgi:hypothetical protein
MKQKGAIMKQFFNILASVLVLIGIVAMAGSAGDCDGKCGPGNSISDMLMYAGIGLAFFVTGALILIQNAEEDL